ncbi:TMEM120B [Cordylochernes scorpioides]|uniref:TMEM120B n=1 Tax=Cordylochernes scorpioides TaxID=51811 RepID=A0ABY6KTG6_9ARAC|nr:TMEM120B [Cordylochernes scorpioides]
MIIIGAHIHCVCSRFKYKDEYEWFKLVVTTIIFAISSINLFVTTRALASLLHFLLVWYYCTLTIRESILILNGSRMKGWWRVHHFITTIQAGIIVVWPDGMMYDMFRTLFHMYTCYTMVVIYWVGAGLVQFLQFRYQQGCLYRLRALGERYNMDITIEGFHSWMWRGLSFIIPFLALVYIFQLYNAYYLYKLSLHPACVEWQVLWTAIIFLALFLGNTLTTSLVVHQKLREKFKEA